MIVMGRVMATHGVKGWIKVQPFTSSPEALIDQRRWWLALKDGDWREFPVAEARRQIDTLLARLDGLSGREEAAEWRGAMVGVPRSDLPQPAPGEVYLADLIGLKVVNRGGETLGLVAGLLETPAHVIARIERENGAEMLIPLVPSYLKAVELEQRRMVVEWHD